MKQLGFSYDFDKWRLDARYNFGLLNPDSNNDWVGAIPIEITYFRRDSEYSGVTKRRCIWVHQRSCDVPLGLPFNVTQYATLLCMLAQVTGLKPGTIDWSIKDAHIYVNQIDGIKEQIRRMDEEGDLPAPKLWLNPDVDDFFKFDNSRDCKDVKLIDYKHLGKIAFPIAQ